MCGRYASSRKPEDLVGLFDVASWDPTEALAQNWNIGPTDPVYAVLDRAVRGEHPEPVRQLRTLRWGLVPSWAKDARGGARMINARVEGIQEKPSFRKALAKRRCLIPADGYYEWFTPEVPPGTPKSRIRKQPHFITPADGSVLAMAGLYEFWRDRGVPDDDPAAWLCTCTIVTTAAEPALAAIHDRMPLRLLPEHWDAWLDPALDDADEARALLAPPPPGLMEARPVSPAVGNIRNNGPELIRPLEPDGLF
ncbi:SOS response-associated peptidase [Streptacidiphilus carbonis]|uniref:SOS response-associated peptidase n=1 Tax=Streptacidiphilus carbonis TaxID=105422 RepID=UPI0005A62690|nr:SOS response-associated peptidase [Streptacidiphilus carbonis]